jgi:hypothetical protein
MLLVSTECIGLLLARPVHWTRAERCASAAMDAPRMIVPSFQPLLATSGHTRCRSVKNQAAINYDRLPHDVRG